MKLLGSLRFAFALLACSTLSVLSHAHSPFIVPQAYIVDGNGTSVLGGFAEAPFVSELALSGFNFMVTQPAGEVQQLELKGSKYLTVADVDTKAPGSYKILATRENALKFAQVNGKWLRVMQSHAEKLPRLAERGFITPAEITVKMQQAQSTRYEQLVAFFSKDKLTEQVRQSAAKGLDVQFSQHPNVLQAQQAVILTVTVNSMPQKDFSVIALKQWAKIGEDKLEIAQKTNLNGQVELTFPVAGQYFIEVNSPAAPENVKPVAESYRQNIAIQVN